jgi:DNA-binding transcriptional regulator YiaG
MVFFSNDHNKMSDAEYEAEFAEIAAQLRLTSPLELTTLEEVARLFENIPQLWEQATPEEKRKLLSPLIERVYVDMDYSRIGAIVPVPAFRRLLKGAMTRAESSAALLLSEDDAERLEVWSWWRRGRVRLQPTTRQALAKRGGLAVEMQTLALSEASGCATPGEYIRKARIQGGLRQKDLASLLGVHDATVKVWEGGRKHPRREHWQRLLEVLRLSPDIVNELLLEAVSYQDPVQGRLTSLGNSGKG